MNRKELKYESCSIKAKGDDMKSISVHGIDNDILKAVEERARSEGRSVNRIVKDLMAQALGMGEKEADRRHDLADLCGVWTEADEAEFKEATADLEETETGDWR
jgi:hypothetical protein